MRNLVSLEPWSCETGETARIEAGQVSGELKGGMFLQFAYQTYTEREIIFLMEKPSSLLDER